MSDPTRPAQPAAINAVKFRCGQDVILGQRSLIGAINGQAEEVVIGDNVFIGEDVRILAPRVYIGDFTIIHHHTTIYGYADAAIGACCWIGQNVVLNCTAPLTIGRGVTISAYSNLWTHFAGGDPVEGCVFRKRKAASVGDDAWIGVQCTIAPVTIGPKALVLAGSVVTHNVPANRTWGGNPAADLTDKLGAPFAERTVEEKFEHMCELLREYHADIVQGNIRFSGRDDIFNVTPRDGRFTLGNLSIAMSDFREDGSSIFDVRDRSYSKRRTPDEIGFMSFLMPLVKFYPR